MPDSGRKNDTSQFGKLKTRRPATSFSTSSFFDASFVGKVAAEASAAATDVQKMSARADFGGIELAKLSVSQYSSTAGQVSASIGIQFFQNVEPEASTPQKKDENSLTPFIDRIEVEFNKDGGMIDGFITRTFVSVTRQEMLKARAVRIFRADLGPSKQSVPLSIVGIGKIATQTGRKGADKLTTYERTQRERGTLGGLTQIQPDGLRAMRMANPSGEVRTALTQGDVQQRLSVKNLSGITSTTAAQSIDPGVAMDLKTISRVRSVTGQAASKMQAVGRLFVPRETGRRDIIRPEATETSGKSGVQGKRNSPNFREVFFSTIDNVGPKAIGDIVEFSYVDRSVLRGSRYVYYVVLVDRQMRESKRSEMVTVLVDNLRSPATPEILLANDGRRVYVQAISSDQFTEKFEIYRRQHDTFSKDPHQLLAISGQSGSLLSLVTRTPTRAGWVQVGEVLASQDQRASFSDGKVVPGATYDYRIYAVNCFGNKSSSPAESTIEVRTGKNPLSIGSLIISADIDQRTKKTVVNVYVDDPTVRAIFIARRDVTIREQAFKDPHTPDRPRVNAKDSKRYRNSDPVLFDQRAGWNGHIQLNGTGSVTFKDNTVRFDHSYQYRAYGVDSRGILTPYAFSETVFVSRKPLVNSPAEFAVVLSNEGVNLSWKGSNLLFSSTDLLGSRNSLEDSSAREIYEVQRREIGGVKWDTFPMMEATSFVDPIIDVTPAEIRPNYPKIGRTYLYRVATLQSGNFYSNFTPPVAVTIGEGVDLPTALVVRCSDTRVRPMYTVVNWSSQGTVDHWVIDRAAVNNLASARLSNIDAISGLDFANIALVTPESSRASSRGMDGERERDPDLFVGDRFFIDHDVEIGNTYFYRLRAVSVTGVVSEPIYRGILISNSTFERKLAGIITTDERTSLVQSGTPMTLVSEKFK